MFYKNIQEDALIYVSHLNQTIWFSLQIWILVKSRGKLSLWCHMVEADDFKDILVFKKMHRSDCTVIWRWIFTREESFN